MSRTRGRITGNLNTRRGRKLCLSARPRTPVRPDLLGRTLLRAGRFEADRRADAQDLDAGAGHRALATDADALDDREVRAGAPRHAARRGLRGEREVHARPVL